jgi:hypothetical protein
MKKNKKNSTCPKDSTLMISNVYRGLNVAVLTIIITRETKIASETNTSVAPTVYLIAGVLLASR